MKPVNIIKGILCLVSLVFATALVLSCNNTKNSDRKEEIASINVFVKCSPNVEEAIRTFNNNLMSKGLLTKYNLKPFLKNHPVHLTLYLTDYDITELGKIKEYVKTIAQDTKKFPIETSNFSLSAGNWILLGADKNKQLQKLSDNVISKLNALRYKGSEVPSWAMSIPAKKESFEKYGSPNAFSQFDPHFSVLAANITKENQKAFTSDINSVIGDSNIKPMTTEVESIGIGFTDSYGQVTKVEAIFPLQ
ncbi:MAG: hypothetical protein WCR55_07385 [Lentisphaerota bacterium]